MGVEIYNICKKTENECMRKKSGKYDWSPKLDKAIKILTYWRARKKYSDNNPLVAKLGQEININYQSYLEEEIIHYINNSRNELKKVQENAIEYRKKHLTDLATKYAKENKMRLHNAIQEIISHKSIRSTFNLLQGKLKKQKKTQLDKIWIAKDDDGNYTKDLARQLIVEEEEQVHEHLLRRNKKQLTQAKNTPLATGRLANALKSDGTGDLGRDTLSEDILNKKNSNVQYSCISRASRFNK